jgi:Type II secretion system (T2SS), protein E, N-terminal domain
LGAHPNRQVTAAVLLVAAQDVKRQSSNAMPVSVTSNEEAQLSQTIEMFEVITQSQPLDYQSLEILKEAYSKLGRHPEAVRTSKRIAEAYVSLGQLSSAILEYESILQRFPGDPDVQKALGEIAIKASNVAVPKPAFESDGQAPVRAVPTKNSAKPASPAPVDDGRQHMFKVFVEGKLLSAADFNVHWPVVDQNEPIRQVGEPFIQVLADRQMVPLDTSLKLLVEKARLGYLPLERYDIDMDLARGFPREACQRWCVLPFDRMSKSVLVATANPFNRQAAHDLEDFAKSRLLWYLASPTELLKVLRKVFR